MKNTLSIVPDETFKNDGYGCILNGDLHVTPSLYDRIFKEDYVDLDLVSNLVIIDMDELVYIENLEFMLVFAGQQVRVFRNGKYIGDGTVTSYPFMMKFETAEVTMHFPMKGEIITTPVSFLEPIPFS